MNRFQRRREEVERRTKRKEREKGIVKDLPQDYHILHDSQTRREVRMRRILTHAHLHTLQHMSVCKMKYTAASALKSPASPSLYLQHTSTYEPE